MGLYWVEGVVVRQRHAVLFCARSGGGADRRAAAQQQQQQQSRSAAALQLLLCDRRQPSRAPPNATVPACWLCKLFSAAVAEVGGRRTTLLPWWARESRLPCCRVSLAAPHHHPPALLELSSWSMKHSEMLMGCGWAELTLSAQCRTPMGGLSDQPRPPHQVCSTQHRPRQYASVSYEDNSPASCGSGRLAFGKEEECCAAPPVLCCRVVFARCVLPLLLLLRADRRCRVVLGASSLLARYHTHAASGRMSGNTAITCLHPQGGIARGGEARSASRPARASYTATTALSSRQAAGAPARCLSPSSHSAHPYQACRRA